MRRLLTKLDDALEGLTTFVYGPLPAGEERPSLWVKLGVLMLMVTLIVIGVAAR